MPTKDKNGIDIYDHSNYSAPVHAVIGMAGFTLDKFPNDVSGSQDILKYINTNTHTLLACTYTCMDACICICLTSKLGLFNRLRWKAGVCRGLPSSVMREGMQQRKS